MEFTLGHFFIVILVAAVSSGLAASVFYSLGRQRYEFTCAVMIEGERCCLTPTRAFIPDATDVVMGVSAHIQVCVYHAEILNNQTFKTLPTHVFDTH